MDYSSSTFLALKRRARALIKGAFKVLLGFLSTLLVLLMVSGALLLGRLSQGPLDVTALSRYLEPVILYKNPQNGAEDVTLHWSRISVQWYPARASEPSALDIDVKGVKTVSETGHVFDSLSDLRFALVLSSLWRGSVTLLRAHAENGVIGLVLKGKSYWALGGLLPLDSKKSSSSHILQFDLFPFPTLDVNHLKVSLKREKSGQGELVLNLSKLVALYKNGTGWKGDSEFSVDQNGGTQNQVRKNSQRNPVDFSVSVQPDGMGRTQWSAHSSMFNPSDYKSWVPGGESLLSMFDLPFSLEGSGLFQRKDRGGSWEDFTLHLLTGAGLYRQVGASPIRVEKADFTFYGKKQEKDKVAVRIKEGTLLLHDEAGQEVPFSFTGQMEANELLSPQNIKIIFAFTVPKLDFAHLASVWPIGVAKGGRRWMGANITSGIAENFTLKVTLASQTGWDDLNDTNLEGSVWGHDLTVHWLKPLPPVNHIEAYGHFLSADAMQIDLKNGHMAVQGGKGIGVPEGRVVLTGLAKPDQMGDIKLGLYGPVQDFLTVLAYPRLHLLSRYALSLPAVKGNLEGKLGVVLPLDANVLMSEIGFDSHASFKHVAFNNKTIGDVTGGRGTFHVTGDEISTDVKVNIRQIPVSFMLWDSFKNKPPGEVNRQVKAGARIDRAGLKSFGINISPEKMQGSMLVRAGFDQKEIAGKKQQGDLNLTLTMTPAAFHGAVWKKEKGIPAFIVAHARFLNGTLHTIDQLDGRGPDLAIKGKALVTKGEVTGLRIKPLHIGRNQGDLTVNWPGSRKSKPDYKVFFDGTSLDLSPLLGLNVPSKKDKGKKKQSGPLLSPIILPQGNWAVAFKADKLYYNGPKVFSTFLAGAHWSGQSMQEVHISVARPYRLNLVLEDRPFPEGGKSFSLYSQNLGMFLSDFNVSKRLDGGRFLMKGSFVPSGKSKGNVIGLGLGPFHGRAELEDMALLNPPAFLKLATLLTPSEWRQIGSDRLGHIKASVDFTMDDQNLVFQKGQLGNAVLGGRFRGRITIHNRAFEMQGTVSPFFSYKDLSQKPFVKGPSAKLKKTFSLAALTYKIAGTVDDPHLEVSPFSNFSPAP